MNRLRVDILLDAANVHVGSLLSRAWVFSCNSIIQALAVCDLQLVQSPASWVLVGLHAAKKFTQHGVGVKGPVNADVAGNSFRCQSGSTYSRASIAFPVNEVALGHHFSAVRGGDQDK